MSDKEDYLDFSNIVRDEYESELYGFTLRSFTKENHIFVETKINEAMDELINNFVGLVEEAEPELRENIKVLGKSVASEVVQSCQKDIKKVNDVIIRELSIPDNVLLLNDHRQAEDLKSTATEQELRDDCERLTQTVKENAFFILSLNRELESLKQLSEATSDEEFLCSKAEEHLNTVFNLELLQDTVNKIKDLK